MNGKLIIFSGPSGGGKTSIIKYLLEKGLKLEFSVSACSRPKRIDEVEGKDYYFLSVEEFKNRIAKNEFVEWEEVYEGNFYGTLKTEIERIHKQGNHVVFDLDVVGGLNIKEQYQSNALSIFVMPPSIDELNKRLIGRGTESTETISKRIAKASKEMTFSGQFDKVIVNSDLKKAREDAYQLLIGFLEK
jgi:guanylate kinase